MNRRELLKQIAILTGGVVIGGEVFLSGCKTATREMGFTTSNLALLDEIGETILPATGSPGAKAVKIAEFMKIIVSDCYSEKDQNIFNEGLVKLEEACKKSTKKSFMECSAEERHAFIVELDKETKEYQKKKSAFDKQQQEIKQKQQTGKGEKDPVSEEMPNHYFTMIKQLTLWGFFTSKEGITKALNYQPVPGKYLGCVDYKKGDKIQVGLDG